MSIAGTRTGEAGPRGTEVRADCWIAITPAERGGRDLRVRSKVGAMYGTSIRALLESGLDALGIAHATVEVEDGGALPYVMAARLEAAARRAIPGLDREFLPAFTAAEHGPGTEPPFVPRRGRMRRSRLYLPGNQPRFMPNAGLHGGDAIILDLEDSVAPAVKDEARRLVRNALRALDFGCAERMVRVNQGERGIEDLDVVVPHGLEVILVPKCESAADVRAIADRSAAIAKAAKVAPPLLMPIVESAKGVLAAFEIASASDRVIALTIGLEDYTADLGVPRTATGEETVWARSMVVNAACAAGVAPIDSVFGDVGDMAALEAWGRTSRAMGFTGMGCIHPRQIPVIHRAFAPTPAEIARARDIVAAFDEAIRAGHGVVALGSRMIDAPVVKRARDTMRMASEMGLA